MSIKNNYLKQIDFKDISLFHVDKKYSVFDYFLYQKINVSLDNVVSEPYILCSDSNAFELDLFNRAGFDISVIDNIFNEFKHFINLFGDILVDDKYQHQFKRPDIENINFDYSSIWGLEEDCNFFTLGSMNYMNDISPYFGFFTYQFLFDCFDSKFFPKIKLCVPIRDTYITLIIDRNTTVKSVGNIIKKAYMPHIKELIKENYFKYDSTFNYLNDNELLNYIELLLIDNY